MNTKKCNGVNKNVVNDEMSINDYEVCLRKRIEQLRLISRIKSYGHELFTERINKIALSSNDDKRVVMDDGINTLAYGHWKLKEIVNA